MPVFEIQKENEWPEQDEFLQSYEYGEFLISLNKKVLRLCIDVEGQKTYVQAVKHSMYHVITFLYIPRAFFDGQALKELVAYAKMQGYTFIRIEPSKEIDVTSLLSQEVKNRQPQYTWILDVTKSVEELFGNMHSKTRYNIRVAEKKGITNDHTKNVDIFLKLNETTTKRNKFISHPKQYIEKLLLLPYVFQFNVLIGEIPLASAIILRHKKSFIYLLGASSNEHRNLMAPYLLHWDIINTAKKEGIDEYDFWGIAAPAKQEDEDATCFHNYCFKSSHPLSGVSRFKAGWGGGLRKYPKASEIILHSFLYHIVRFLHLFRKGNNVVGHPLN